MTIHVQTALFQAYIKIDTLEHNMKKTLTLMKTLRFKTFEEDSDQQEKLHWVQL